MVLCEIFCDNKGALFNDVQLFFLLFQSVFLICIINGVHHNIKDVIIYFSVKKIIETPYERDHDYMYI